MSNQLSSNLQPTPEKTLRLIEQLKKYEAEGAYPVSPDIDKIEKLGIDAVPAKLLNDSNLVRHNPRKLAITLLVLIYRLRLFGKGVQFFDYFFARLAMLELKNK